MLNLEFTHGKYYLVDFKSQSLVIHEGQIALNAQLVTGSSQNISTGQPEPAKAKLYNPSNCKP